MDPFELAALRQRRSVLGDRPPVPQEPTAFDTAFSNDIRRLGTTLYGAAANIPGLVGAHQAEYSPGMSVQDMPQTMEKLPEAAMSIVGTPIGPTGAPGTTLTSGMRVPPLLGAYHGTSVPNEFSKFKLPAPNRDLGVYATINPLVAEQYAYDATLGPNVSAGGRVKPVLLDVRNAFRFPEDIGKWSDPNFVLETLKNHMEKGFKAPKGLLSDMQNIAGSPETWQKNFAPMLQNRGYDAAYFPHGVEYLPNTFGQYNSFMMLDPERIIHRYSKEGQKLAAQRGVHEPMTEDASMMDITKPWRIPRGILTREETETLKKLSR